MNYRLLRKAILIGFAIGAVSTVGYQIDAIPLWAYYLGISAGIFTAMMVYIFGRE